MQDEIEAVNKDSATHKSGQEVNTFEDTCTPSTNQVLWSANFCYLTSL